VPAPQAKVAKRRRRRDPAPRRALEQPALDQVRLVRVRDRVGLLADRHSKRRQTHRPALKAKAQRGEDVAIESLKSLVVDLQERKRRR
jgi:hypothetical protein